jgi:hypothetical protein
MIVWIKNGNQQLTTSIKFYSSLLLYSLYYSCLRRLHAVKLLDPKCRYSVCADTENNKLRCKILLNTQIL